MYKETSGEISAQKKRALSYGGWIGIGSNDLWPTEIILYWKYARQVLNSWKTGVKKILQGHYAVWQTLFTSCSYAKVVLDEWFACI